ncbi:hypothetical protein [Flavobacterium sp.]
MKNYFKLCIIIFCVPNSAMCQLILGQKQEYVYNNLKDTIQFSEFEPKITKSGGYNPSTEFYEEAKITDSIQIDGIGRKELVFYRFYRFSNSQHGGSFDIDENIEIGKYEVWNLDTKTILFEVINYRKDDFNRFTAGRIPPEKGTYIYKYNVKIDDLGTITIKKEEIEPTFIKKKKNKIKLISKNKIKSVKVDSIEGIYKFDSGKYIKIANQE